MNTIFWHDLIDSEEKYDDPYALTIGVFDGLHKGHRKLIEAVNSKKPLLKSCAVTFTINPSLLLQPEHYQGDIFTLKQKISAFERLGFDLLILIDFSKEFSKLTGRQFFSGLNRKIRLKYLALGSDFACGYKGDTSADEIKNMLEKNSITVDIADTVMQDGKPVSSSRIRMLILEGKLQEAEKLLGRAYVLDLTENEVQNRIDCCGNDFSLNGKSLRQVVPANGSYQIILETNGNPERTELTAENFILRWHSSSRLPPERIIFSAE
jgi:riboflavin kinase/FMN adenylyltransferase